MSEEADELREMLRLRRPPDFLLNMTVREVIGYGIAIKQKRRAENMDICRRLSELGELVITVDEQDEAYISEWAELMSRVCMGVCPAAMDFVLLLYHPGRGGAVLTHCCPSDNAARSMMRRACDASEEQEESGG